MNTSHTYRCNLVIHLICKNYNGRKILSNRTEQVPITGSQGTAYKISYLNYLPAHFHLAPQSSSVLSGRLEVQQGRPFLSTAADTLVYEANAGTINITYLDQNNQQIGSRIVKDDVGKPINDILTRVKIPSGYKYARGNRQFVIRPTAQFSVMYLRRKRVPKVYLLMIRIIERNGAHDAHVYRKVTTKTVKGFTGDHYQVDYQDFIAPGYHLDSDSAPVIKGRITDRGLKPGSGLFVFDKVHRPQQTRVTYVNQNQDQVGSRSIQNVSDRAFRHTIEQLNIPTGYYYASDQSEPNDQDGRVMVRVQGRAANQKQNAVHFLVVKKTPKGRLISRLPKIIHVSGRIGDTFRITAGSQCPPYFINSGNPVISGTITPRGTRMKHRSFTYTSTKAYQKAIRAARHISRVKVEYIKQGRTLKKTVVHGKIGRKINVLDKLPLPKGCFLLSGQFPWFRIRQRPQTIRYRIADRSNLFRKRTPSSSPSSKAVQSAGMQAARALRKHAAVSGSSSSASASSSRPVDTNHRRTFKMPRHHFHRKASRQQHSAGAQSRRQSDHRSKAARTADRSGSGASSSVRKASQHSRSSSAGQQKAQRKRPAKENPVKKGFLDEYYEQIFGDYLERDRLRRDRKYQIGTEIAKRFISGIDDALKGRSARSNRGKNYTYGYRTFQLIVAKHYQGKRLTRLSVLLIIVRRILQRFIAQNRDYYTQQISK